MEISNTILFFKLFQMLFGMLTIFLGYKLFMKGFYNDSGEVKIKVNSSSVLIKKAAPGTFFSVLGTILIAVAIFKGVEYNSEKKSKQPMIETRNDLLIDSSINSIPRKSLRIDSLYDLALKNETEKKYLTALKYYYIVKGMLLTNDSLGISYDKINHRISKLEIDLQKSIDIKPEIITEETRSTKISDSNNDSIR